MPDDNRAASLVSLTGVALVLASKTTERLCPGLES